MKLIQKHDRLWNNFPQISFKKTLLKRFKGQTFECFKTFNSYMILYKSLVNSWNLF